MGIRNQEETTKGFKKADAFMLIEKIPGKIWYFSKPLLYFSIQLY